MSIYEVGRLCVKLAGRDAGKKCVILEQFDNTYVLVDGATRRKKVNVKHLEPLAEVIKIKNNASHEDVKAAFTKLRLEVMETNPKQTPERVKPQRGVKEKVHSEKKKAKAPKAAKKEMVEEETKEAAAPAEEKLKRAKKAVKKEE